MLRLCRYDALATAIAFFDGVVLTEPLAPCPDPAVAESKVARTGDGCTAEIYTDLCRAHDLLVTHAEGYVRSNRLRQPTASV